MNDFLSVFSVFLTVFALHLTERMLGFFFNPLPRNPGKGRKQNKLDIKLKSAQAGKKGFSSSGTETNR